MSTSLDRRLAHAEANRQMEHAEQNPYRIPEWMRPWFDPLTVEDLEILEAGGFPEGSDGDPVMLPPAQRERYDELETSWQRFAEEHQP